MKTPKTFNDWEAEKQDEWFSKEIKKCEKRMDDLKNQRTQNKIDNAKSKREKPIKKFYSLSQTHKKNRLIHELMVDSILPFEYFDDRYDERIIGNVFHRREHYSSNASFHKMDAVLLKPIIVQKRADRPDEVAILLTHGFICEKCLDFRPLPRIKNKSAEDLEYQFLNIQTRKQLANFLRLARKGAIQVERETCSRCQWIVDEDRKRSERERINTHLKELQKHTLKVRGEKSPKNSKGKPEKDAYKFLEMANAASSIANYKPNTTHENKHIA